MRTSPLFLLLPLLLAGCVRQSASYYPDEQRVRAITVRAEQQTFWNKDVDLILVASNMPDCQRRFALGTMPVAEVVVELFSAGDSAYTVRAGKTLLQIEVQNCTQMAAPDPNAIGVPVGVFRIGPGEKMDLEVLKPAADAVPVAAPPG